MGKELSFFTDYKQGENRVTNYCGLLLKMLYQENPSSFAEVISLLLGENEQISVDTVFEQQKRSGNSVPDLCIRQDSFTILFEVKLTNWFHEGQIVKHLQGLQKANKMILFLLAKFEEDDEGLDKLFPKEIEQAKLGGFLLKPTSFKTFVRAFDNVKTSTYFDTLLEEFKTYLEFSDLLPSWKYLLDVVNCGKSLEEFENGHYLCPDTRGPYSHKRAKYMGAYSEKNVSMVAEIKALITVSTNMEEFTIKWKNTGDEDFLINEAKKVFISLPSRVEENKSVSYQIFLLDKVTNVAFNKDTPGGMYGSKQYFPNIEVNSIEELVKTIDGKNWSDFLKSK